MISIISYGLGNVQALMNVYERLNIRVTIASSPEALTGSTKLILPGVGAFDDAMERFQRSGMRETVERMVFEDKLPVLGICVGMQMLAASSEEGKLRGLEWIPGRVVRFKKTGLPLPHMGWNDVGPSVASPLFRGLEKDARFYFLHSYYFECNEAADILASAEYGGDFACAVRHGNVYGVQFHPEKSHRCGMELLKNFATL